MCLKMDWKLLIEQIRCLVGIFIGNENTFYTIFKKTLDKMKKSAIMSYDADVCVRLSVAQKSI